MRSWHCVEFSSIILQFPQTQVKMDTGFKKYTENEHPLAKERKALEPKLSMSKLLTLFWKIV